MNKILIVQPRVGDDTPTLVSDVVQFDLEYRCFVLHGYVMTWSNYICYDNINDSRYWDMIPVISSKKKFDRLTPAEFVTEVCRSHIITEPSVVDVGRIKGKGYAIIETNQAWASGLYGCDPLAALKVMEKSVE